MRVEGYDHTIVPRTKVKVGLFDLSPYLGPASGSSATKSKGWGIDKFNEPTNAHAVVKVLNNHGVNYDFQDYGWSLYIAMMDGDREFDEGPMSGWMYSVNGQLPPVGCNAKPLEDGDEILWFYGAYGFDTAVTKLHANKTSVKPGEEVSVTLDGFTTSGAGGEDKVSHYDKNSEKISNATIFVDGKEFKVDGKVVKTDSDGKATLKFKRAGKYELSAVRYKKSQGNKIDIVRPLPVEIDVEGDAVKDGKEDEKQKKEEESQLVKDAKDEINENSVDSNKLQKEIKGDKEEYTASYSVCIGSADKISEIIKKAIPKAKDDKEKEKIKKEVAVVPIKINDKKENVVLKIKGDTVKALKNKNIGVKVSFSNSGITIPYDVLPNIKADEHIEIRKNILKDAVNKSLCSSISKKNNILSKVYNLSAFKVDKNNKEEKINIDKEYVYVVMKVNSNEVKNMSKRSLKINWYDTKNKKWITLDSQYMKDKNVVVGRLK
ncbi:DUF4430 domain-containing protein [Haloimpatiens sp. FM7330]|uniref:DUF4430 domain-containing protein n=1 Tax=Haloimpatiens sp. FM7330 TaxID=3298610 RepID=UPI00362CEB8C